MNSKNPKASPARVLFLSGEDHLFWGHTLPVARAALRNGYDVVVATTFADLRERIQNEGFRLVPLKLVRRIDAPWRELRSLYQVRKAYRTEKPDIVHHLNIKSVLYGSIARLGMKDVGAINAVTGMGYLATATSWKANVVRWATWRALRFLLNRPRQFVVLENREDKDRLTSEVKVSPGNLLVTRGAGVDVDLFQPSPEPGGQPVVLLASRMLRIKGIEDFVQAARILKSKGVSARFILSGASDPNNPSCIPQAALKDWERSGVVEWWGQQTDMASVYRQSNVICLPSHGGEGIPKVIMEAAASGRAIVTTDVPGCRDVVRHGINGLVVPPRDTACLAEAIERLIASPELRQEMGRKGREIAVSEYSQREVVEQMMRLYEELLRPSNAQPRTAKAATEI